MAQERLTSLARILILSLFLVGQGCKTSGNVAAPASEESTESKNEIPPVCNKLKDQAEKIEGLLSEPEGNNKNNPTQDDAISEDLDTSNAEKDTEIADYTAKLEELRQSYATCAQRALSMGEECTFPGSARASSDEPCRCYRELTDPFEKGVNAKIAATNSKSCLEYFEKVSPEAVQTIMLDSGTQPQDRIPPQVDKSQISGFTGCLCATAGQECLMWRPEEKLAEVWITGTCTAETCQLLSQSAPNCALLYQLVQ